MQLWDILKYYLLFKWLFGTSSNNPQYGAEDVNKFDCVDNDQNGICDKDENFYNPIIQDLSELRTDPVTEMISHTLTEPQAINSPDQNETDNDLDSYDDEYDEIDVDVYEEEEEFYEDDVLSSNSYFENESDWDDTSLSDQDD